MLDTRSPTAADRTVLVGLYAVDASLAPDKRLDELQSLVEAARGEVVARAIQRRGLEPDEGPVDRPIDPATYIGKGKVEHVASLVEEHHAELVVFDNELSPAQIRELEERIECRVIDRSELILDIFAARARTRAAKLQVELAQLQYTAPRLRGMWTHLARQAGGGGAAGGIGTRGPGEQQIEVDRRIVQRRLTRLRSELEEVVARRERQVTARTDKAWTVGLVGYTNAGKSTLMNALTDADAYVRDELFATLDTTSRRWAVRPGVDIPLSDTVGFVRDLPHHLVASFRSTLAEALHADLLLHVVDASAPDAMKQIEVVHEVLGELGVEQKRVLGVLNKADLLDDLGELGPLQSSFDRSVTISAVTGEGLEALADAVVDRRSADWTELEVLVPHDEARLAALVHEHGEVIDEAWEHDGWHATISVPHGILWQIEEYAAA